MFKPIFADKFCRDHNVQFFMSQVEAEDGMCMFCCEVTLGPSY